MSQPSKGGDPTSASSYGSPAYSWYVILLLAAVYACHALDRGLPSILIEPIRAEFSLSDSQLGLFSLAYAAAFSSAVLPMGYLADRVVRRNMLALIVLLWSAMTAFGGIARNYAQLIAIRFGVGATEAGAAPLALPMISDMVPPGKRSFALGIFYISSPVGGLLASVVGAYVAADHGWRAAFLVAGLPGILLAALLYFTVREPKRGGSDAGGATAEKPPGPLECFAFLFRTPALFCLMCACALMGLMNITIGFWMSSFFIRLHEVSLKETGLILGIGGGLIGMASPPITGWLADRFGARSIYWPLRIVWISALLSFGFTLAMLSTGSLVIAVVCFVIADFMRLGYSPPTYAVLMTNTPPRMRGSVMSVLQLMTNIVGYGVGPAVTGLMSDLYGGGTGIKPALFNVSFVFLAVAGLLMLSNRLLYGRRPPGVTPAAATA
jgi:MFS family permease